MQLQKIEGELGELGYQLIAITPDSPADLVRTKEKHGLSYQLLSDGGFNTTRAFGIGFQVPKKKPLPVPAVFIVGVDGKIQYMLFDLEKDPHETTSLAAQRPDLVGHGLRLIDQWMAERMGDSLRGDPFWGVIREGGPLHANEKSPGWKNYVERLRQTGRGHHADNLEKFGGRPFTSGLE